MPEAWLLHLTSNTDLTNAALLCFALIDSSPVVIRLSALTLVQMSSLESLGLSRCALEPEPLVALLQAAQLNKKLQALTLDASSNPIGMAGAHMLAAVLPQCTKVTGLFLDDVSSTVPYPFPLVGWPTQEGSMGMGGGGGSNGVDTSSGGGPESTCIGIQISEAFDLSKVIFF